MRLCSWKLRPVRSWYASQPDGNAAGVHVQSFTPPPAPFWYHHESSSWYAYGSPTAAA